jgi:thiamine-phosphate diphosphorylase
VTELPPLHLLTDDEVCARPDFHERCGAMLEAGGARLAFHLRAPRASGRWLYDAAVRLVEAAGRSRSRLVVNDRVDVALAAGARGVHLGERSLPVEAVRGLVPEGFLVGVSVHGVDRIPPAADWLMAGSVYPTPSHPGAAGAGLDLIRGLAGRGAAVVAVGGVTPERVRELRQAGAAGVAVIRGVWDDADPAGAVERYLNAWDGA